VVDARLAPGVEANAGVLAQAILDLARWQVAALRLSLDGGPPRDYAADRLRLDLAAYRELARWQGRTDPERELRILFGPVLDSTRLIQRGATLELGYAGCAGLEPFLALHLAVAGAARGADRFVITRPPEGGGRGAPVTFTLAQVSALRGLERRNPADCNRLFPAVRPLDLDSYRRLHADLMERGVHLGRFRRVDGDDGEEDLDALRRVEADPRFPAVSGAYQQQRDPWSEHPLLIEYGDHPIADSPEVRAVVGGAEGFELVRLRHGGNVYTVEVPDLPSWTPAELRELLRQLVLVEAPLAVPAAPPRLRLARLEVWLGKRPLPVVVAAGHTHGGRSHQSHLLFSPLRLEPADPPPEGELFVLFPLPSWDAGEPGDGGDGAPPPPPPRGRALDAAAQAGDVTLTLAFDSPNFSFSTRRATPGPAAWRGVSIKVGGRSSPVGDDGRVTIQLPGLVDLRAAARGAVERTAHPGGATSAHLLRPEAQRGLPRLTLSCPEAKLDVVLRFAATDDP
jgi:hypothetical protein